MSISQSSEFHGLPLATKLAQFACGLLLVAPGLMAQQSVSEGFESTPSILTVSATNATFIPQDSAVAHTGVFSFRTNPSGCPYNCWTNNVVRLVYTFPTTVNLVSVSVWAREGSTTAYAWGGSLHISYGTVPTYWFGDPVYNNNPITGLWEHYTVPVSPASSATNFVQIEVQDITNKTIMWLDDIVITYNVSTPATFLPLGSGCPGSAGTPLLAAQPGSLPRLGTNFQMTLSNLPSATSVAIGVLGLSNSSWGSLPLPHDLTLFGMPGCTQYVSGELGAVILPAQNGQASWSIAIPNNAGLAGAAAFAQGLVPDPPVNAIGATVSNAGTLHLGY